MCMGHVRNVHMHVYIYMWTYISFQKGLFQFVNVYSINILNFIPLTVFL